MDRKPANRPLKIPGRRVVVTKRMVQSAIDNTKSQSAAARWIGIAFNTYKQYAKSYGLWEQYKNQAGVGVSYFNEECSICGWNEPRITDQKICLKLDYMDGNSDNKNIDNMRLLCPNCYFSNNGIFQQSKNFCK